MALLKGCSLRCLASRGRRFFADVPKAVQPSEGQARAGGHLWDQGYFNHSSTYGESLSARGGHWAYLKIWKNTQLVVGIPTHCLIEICVFGPWKLPSPAPQVTPTYPQVYGRVEETVMSPYKGGAMRGSYGPEEGSCCSERTIWHRVSFFKCLWGVQETAFRRSEMSGMKMKAFSDGASPNLTKGSFILRHIWDFRWPMATMATMALFVLFLWPFGQAPSISGCAPALFGCAASPGDIGCVGSSATPTTRRCAWWACQNFTLIPPRTAGGGAIAVGSKVMKNMEGACFWGPGGICLARVNHSQSFSFSLPQGPKTDWFNPLGRYYIDTSYYGGMLDKSHEDFYRYILLYPAIAFFLHCTWCLVFVGMGGPSTRSADHIVGYITYCFCIGWTLICALHTYTCIIYCIHFHILYIYFISLFLYFFTCLLACLVACLLTSLLGCLVAWLLGCLLAAFPPSLLPCLLTYLLTYLFTYLLIYLLTYTYFLYLLYSNLLYLLSYLTLPDLTSPYLYFTLL